MSEAESRQPPPRPPRSWEHRPVSGPVAWGAAVLVVPAVPLLTLVSFVLVRVVLARGDEAGGLDLLALLPGLAVGTLLARPAAGPTARGVGLGLVAGSLVCGLLAWGWSR